MEKTLEERVAPFTFDDIEDVKIIVKANGQHWGILPKGNKEEAKLMRIAMLGALMNEYYVVDKPLEEINQ